VITGDCDWRRLRWLLELTPGILESADKNLVRMGLFVIEVFGSTSNTTIVPTLNEVLGKAVDSLLPLVDVPDDLVIAGISRS
jgi:hypothetical protein